MHTFYQLGNNMHFPPFFHSHFFPNMLFGHMGGGGQTEKYTPLVDNESGSCFFDLENVRAVEWFW